MCGWALDFLRTFQREELKQGRGHFKRDRIAICVDCEPRFDQEMRERDRRQERDVERVCEAIERGDSISVPDWVMKTDWARKKIEQARWHRRSYRNAMGDLR
jgi:hypothetical protein